MKKLYSTYPDEFKRPEKKVKKDKKIINNDI